ncbi:MAG: DUF4129 domain-containing protein [Actinomycetota bacterium]
MDLPPSGHDPDTVRDIADSILADPRYDRPGESLPDRVIDWFGEQIGKVLGSLVGSGAGTVIAWTLVLAAIAVTVLLIVRFGRVGYTPSPQRREGRVMVELTRSPAEWRSEAAALERAGRWREGLRCRHRALIAELVAQGAVADLAGRTAREYVDDVERARPPAATALVEATDLFESAWYGARPTGPSEASRFEDLATEVLSVGAGAR